MVLLYFVSIAASAQDPVLPLPPAPPADIAQEKGEGSEIIIRQKSEKDSRLLVEIKAGEVFINGKPLEKYEDQNITIEKREAEGEGQTMFLGDLRDRARRIQKTINLRMNAAFLGVSSRKTDKGGATVLEITKGSPAEKAGLKNGDIITKVNETKVENPEMLFDAIHQFKAGDKVKISYNREGKVQSAVVTLEKSEPMSRTYKYSYDFNMPPMPPMPPMPRMPSMNDMEGLYRGQRQPRLGIQAQDAEDGKGVNVLSVEDSSAAFKAGLKKGDLILQLNGTGVNSTNELIDQFQDARQKPLVTVKILRGGISQDIDIKIPRKLKTAEL